MGSFRAVARRAAMFAPLRPMVRMGGRLWGRSLQFHDVYSKEFPSQANAVNIFAKEWSSAVPGFETGQAHLFEDERIQWLLSKLGPLQGKRVLELGPLEAGQTSMMEQAGANVVAIEGNQRAFLKCLVIKNAFGLKSEFLYGDFRPYVEKAKPGSFDFIAASGVLYHMTEPVKLLHDIARVADTFGVWTHYYDHHALKEKLVRFDTRPQLQSVDGVSVPVYRQNYLSSVTHKGFCGGNEPHSFWLTKDGLLGYVQSLGFEITIGTDELNHPNGPCILFLARRRR